MKCYYEVLGVARDANEDDVKRSYRKLALQWHPDKNPENAEEAKVQFQLVQQAYEVLSDLHERAWYDKHRESIIRGAAGFGDDDRGFYSVYREVFNKIASEDADFDSDIDSDFEIPSFGRSESPFEAVVNQFYSYWQNYSTKKSYAWLNTYDIREAPQRKIVRLMEKENKKIRSQAKKERNEEVRALVSFVKKRDKRVQAHALLVKEKKDNNLKKSEHHRQERIKERRKEIESHQESEWSKYSNLEKELEDIENNLAAEFGDISEEDYKSSDDEETQEFSEKQNSLYCVACNKLFKTTKAFQNHENSKKHKENLTLLKMSDFCLEDEADSSHISSEDSSDPVVSKLSHSSLDFEEDPKSSSEDDVESCSNQSTKVNGNTFQTDALSTSLGTSDTDLAEEGRNFENAEEVNVKINTNGISAEFIDLVGQSKKQKKKMVQKELLVEFSKSNNARQELNSHKETYEPEEDLSTKSALKTKKSKIRNNVNNRPIDKQNDIDERKSDLCESDDGLAVGSKKDRSKKFTSIEDSKKDNVFCNTCSAMFSSKNKLFEHLKKTGHALAKTGPELDKNIVGRSRAKNTSSKKKHPKSKELL